MHSSFNLRSSGAVSTFLLVTIVSTASTAAASDWQSRTTQRVQNLWNATQNAKTTSSQSAGVDSIPADRQASSSARYDSVGRLQIDVEYDCAQPGPTAELALAGMIIGTAVKAPPICVVEGWALVASIPALASLPHVTKIDLPKYSTPHPPISPRFRLTAKDASITLGSTGSSAIDGTGVTIMNAGTYIQQTSVNGAGVTIGVISDDVTSLSVIQARGELPAVNVVAPSANPMPHPTLTDEGTMMLEEVHAVAPGATLAFCGPQTGVEYLGCLKSLITAGVTVITDDVAYHGYDVMSAPAENAPGLAIANALTATPNVMLFHSVGNDAQDYWQGTYNPSPGSATCNTSGQPVQTDAYLQSFGGVSSFVTWQTQGGKPLILASNVAAGQTTANNFDVYVYNPVTSTIVACGTSASGGTTGATSYTFVDGTSVPIGTYQIFIGTQNASLSGTFLKLIGSEDGGGTFTPLSPGAPSSPQDFAAGVITVGAVDAANGIGSAIELYSDTGPIQLVSPTLFSLQAPFLVAPDDIYVDATGTRYAAQEYNGNFTGTSAASPNAASVAVLLRSAFPTLTPTQVTYYIVTGAAQLGGAAPNSTFGYGRVDALGAQAQIPAPTISGLQGTSIVGGGSSPALPFTVGGTGALKISASPSVGYMTAVVSPSNCGSSAANCTLSLTPSIGASGPSTVQVTVTDGANRSKSMQVPITVTAPPPPSASITSNATQNVIVNSAIAPIGFSIAGTGVIAVSVSESGVPGLNVTSGCGTTTSACTASLGTAGTATGTALVTLTVRDSYGQVTSASATVIILPPAAPTISITGGGSQNVTVNGAIAPVAFTLTGMPPLTITPNTSDVSAITISSGCGTTTMSCTASLGTAQSTPGTATLTLTVEDNYVQSTSATATVTESAAPSKSGGGGLDPWVLLGLTGLVLVQLNRPFRERAR